MDKATLEALIETLDFWAQVFTAIVLLGIGGELLVHRWSSKRSKELQAILKAEEGARQTELARVNNETERLRSDNLALQKILQPRRVALIPDKLDELRAFAGTRILIQTVPDFEATKLEFNIKWLLSQVGWQAESLTQAQSLIPYPNINDGLRLYSPGYRIAAGAEEKMPRNTPEGRTLEAATVLSEYLRSGGIENSVQPQSALSSPHIEQPGTVIMIIGSNPVFGKLQQLGLLDHWNGYGTAHFGQTPAEIGGEWRSLGIYENDASLQLYERPADRLRFGAVPLAFIRYVFRNDRLARVALGTKGVENAGRLRVALTATFGEPTEGAIGRVSWIAEDVDLRHIYGGENRSGEESVATFTHRKLYDATTATRPE